MNSGKKITKKSHLLTYGKRNFKEQDGSKGEAARCWTFHMGVNVIF